MYKGQVAATISLAHLSTEQICEFFADRYMNGFFILERMMLMMRTHYPILVQMVEKKFGYDKNIVGCEVGMRGGMTEFVLLRMFPKLKMYGIDINDSETWLKAGAGFREDRLRRIYKPSDEAVKDIQEKLDFVFLDGGKDYEQNKRDILNYLPLVKKGGLFISWQDGGWEKVWWNGGADNKWPLYKLSKAASEIINIKDVCFDADLLWHINV